MGGEWFCFEAALEGMTLKAADSIVGVIFPEMPNHTIFIVCYVSCKLIIVFIFQHRFYSDDVDQPLK